MVLTDGDANHGIIAPAAILNALANYETYKEPAYAPPGLPAGLAGPQQNIGSNYAAIPPAANNAAVLRSHPASFSSPAVSLGNAYANPAALSYGALPPPNSNNPVGSAAPVAAALTPAAPAPTVTNPAPTPVGPIENLPCTIHTFGFGSDHNSSLLKSIADCGRGMYYFIQTAAEIPPSFTDCLGGLLSVFAQKVELIIEPMNGCDISKADTKFKVTQDGGKTIVHLGDVQSEENRDILFRVSLPVLPHAIEKFDIATISTTYLNLLSGANDTFKVTASVPRLDAPGRIPESKTHVDKQRNRIITTRAMDEAKVLADKGSLPEARKLVQDAIDTIEKSVSGSEVYSRSLIDNLKDVLKSLVDRSSYNNYGSFAISGYSSAHAQQRANNNTPTYTTTSRTSQQSNYASFHPPGQ